MNAPLLSLFTWLFEGRCQQWHLLVPCPKRPRSYCSTIFPRPPEWVLRAVEEHLGTWGISRPRHRFLIRWDLGIFCMYMWRPSDLGALAILLVSRSWSLRIWNGLFSRCLPYRSYFLAWERSEWSVKCPKYLQILENGAERAKNRKKWKIRKKIEKLEQNWKTRKKLKNWEKMNIGV